jgi:hypothetical protein
LFFGARSDMLMPPFSFAKSFACFFAYGTWNRTPTCSKTLHVILIIV